MTIGEPSLLKNLGSSVGTCDADVVDAGVVAAGRMEVDSVVDMLTDIPVLGEYLGLRVNL